MDEIISLFINELKARFGIHSAMVCGSYAKKTMTENSDVDIFCINDDENRSTRGREFFKGIEFEYFISPEWKYYDRIKNDQNSVSTYSYGSIHLDEKNLLHSIISLCKEKVKNYSYVMSEKEKLDCSFFIETIYKDSYDLYRYKKFGDFLVFTTSRLEKLFSIICKMRSKYPLYIKNAIAELRVIDLNFATLLEGFFDQNSTKEEKFIFWKNICDYLLAELGSLDIQTYLSIQEIAPSPER